MKTRLALILAMLAFVTVLFLYVSRRATYFDFAKNSNLAEVNVDGVTVSKPGQNTPNTNITLDHRNILFQRKRALFVNAGNTALSYYLKVPPGARLEFAFMVEGSAGIRQTISEKVEVLSWNGRRVVQEEEVPIRESGAFAFRKSLEMDLSPVANEICRITFFIHGGTPLPPGVRAGWLNPRMTVRSLPPETAGPDPRVIGQLKRIRESNRESNLIIFLLDASNSKHFGVYGYDRNTTPNIDALAREGVTFDNAYCQSVYTVSSTGDLFTSAGSLIHGVYDRGMKLSPDFVTLPEVLQENGFRTASFTSSPNSSSVFGYDQGFDQMFELFRAKAGKALLAERFIDPMFGWLRENSGNRFFAYVHFREPHLPFAEPEPYSRMFDPDYDGTYEGDLRTAESIFDGTLKPEPRDIQHLVSLYDGNLAYVDHVVGRILAELKQLNLYERTVILVISDHGEALWEHGYQGHNIKLYEENIRIPMILRIPATEKVPRPRVDQLARTIDAYPTMLDLFGIEASRNPHAQGKSVLPHLFLAGEDPGSEVITHTTHRSDFSLRTGRYKYIGSADESDQLYDILTDPGETRSLHLEQPVLTGYLRSRVKSFQAEQLEKLRKFGIHPAEAPTIDQDTREKLKALGYVE